MKRLHYSNTLTLLPMISLTYFFIISITETWTNADNKDLVNIKDFTALINSRKGEKGGVGLFVWKSVVTLPPIPLKLR